MKDFNKKVEQKLAKHLGREGKPNEKGNAVTDPTLIAQVLIDEIDDLEKRVAKLEK